MNGCAPPLRLNAAAGSFCVALRSESAAPLFGEPVRDSRPLRLHKLEVKPIVAVVVAKQPERIDKQFSRLAGRRICGAARLEL